MSGRARPAVGLGAPLLAALAAQAAVPAAAIPAEPWRPAVVSSPQFESHPAWDLRNGDLYFVRSSPQFQGWRILVSRCRNGAWAPAVPAEFSGEGVEADPYITPNGARVWFISSRRDGAGKSGDDLDIWYADRRPDGRWGAPVRLPAPVNSPAPEWFPRPDGRGGLYFGSGRAGGFGQTDIYHAVQEGGQWRVTNVGGTVSTAGNDYEFEPAENGQFAILMSGGALYRVDRAGDGWGPRQPIDSGAPGFHVGPTLSRSGRTLLFARGGDPALAGELYRLTTGAAEAWPACPQVPVARAQPAVLPRPTGPFPVGRARIHLVDNRREETMTPEAGDWRQLMATIWYPAAAAGSPAPYIDVEAASPLFQRSYSFDGIENLLGVRTNSSAGARIARRPQRFPVILFSHGLGTVAALYSALLENLASQGYVVVGVDHPYFSSAFYLPDGTLTFNVSRDRQGEAVIQAQDLVFVLDRLARLDRDDPRFRGRLDLGHVGVFGHSRGGFAAPHACLLDARFDACLNLDGYELTNAVMQRGIAQPYMHIQEQYPWQPAPTDAELAAAHQTRAQADQEIAAAEHEWAELFGRMRGGATVVNIAGGVHASFSDGPLVAPDHHPGIRLDAARGLAITNAYILAFFDAYLRGRPSPLLTGATPYPEVTLRRYGARR